MTASLSSANQQVIKACVCRGCQLQAFTLLVEGAKAFQQQLDVREALDNFMAASDGYHDKICARMHKVGLDTCPLLFLSCGHLLALVTVGQMLVQMLSNEVHMEHYACILLVTAGLLCSLAQIWKRERRTST